MARSENQAKNVLTKLYTGTPLTATVSRARLFEVTGKSDDNQKDRNAVYNLLSAVRAYELINTIYDTSNSNALVGITLTAKGKQWLENPAIPGDSGVKTLVKEQIPPEYPKVVTLQHLSDMADLYMQQNPSWVVDVTPTRKGI
jgi:hypothetical protein